MVGREVLQHFERDIMLQVVDTQWKDHLYSLDHLKEGIGLRGYGQNDPLVEYKKESFALFQDMKARIDEETVRFLFRARVTADEGGAPVRRAAPRRAAPMTFSAPGGGDGAGFFGSGQDAAAGRGGAPAAAPYRRRRRAGEDGPPRRAESRPQRSLPVREREEIQEVPRGPSLRDDAWMCTP